MFQSSVKLTGHLSIKKYNEKDELVYETDVPNLVVNAGKAFIASRIISDSDFPVMSHMAVGDDASSVTVGQTALVNELARVEFNSATTSGANVTFTAIFPGGTGTGELVEAAIHNQDDTSVLVFDGDNDVDSGNHIITYVAHGLVTGDSVTYTDGGGVALTNLIDGNTYYVIRESADEIKLATSLVNAEAGTFIEIADGSGAAHKLTYGTMLCRTTFPVISKSISETVAISWVVTVG